MKYVYLFRMEENDEERHPIAVSSPQVIALLVLAASVVLVGTVFAPWFGFANAAAANLF
jgi:hypothetical protein